MKLRSMDAFVKAGDQVASPRSALGGLISLIASGVAGVLLLAQLSLFLGGSTRHSFHLSPSVLVKGIPTHHEKHASKRHTQSTIPLHLHVTFPFVACSKLDVSHDNARMATGDFQKLHGNSTLTLRLPQPWEIEAATKQQSDSTRSNTLDGCTLEGTIDIPKVGGTFAAKVADPEWQKPRVGKMTRDMAKKENLKFYNVSHFVHAISFGEPFPLAHNPLENTVHAIDNEWGGIGLFQLNVRLVTTRYKRLFAEREMYQASVANHIVQPEFMATSTNKNVNPPPGLVVSYDFTSIAVRHVEHRDNVLVFVSSLVSIVGGVLVTVGLISSVVVRSAATAATAIKKD